MRWSEIRECYPEQWLLLEALHAHSEANCRILEQLSVLESFVDSDSAIRKYNELQREVPARELYVFHTSREALEIPERRWLGIRAPR